MRRMIAIAQIASMLVGPIVCAPHSHADMAADGHSNRPHVHLRGMASHGHRHRGHRQGSHHHAGQNHRHLPRSGHQADCGNLNQHSPVFRGKSAAHDADAIYLTTATVSAARNLGGVDAIQPVWKHAYLQADDDRARIAHATDWDHLLRPPNESLPVYLKTLRLRC